MRLGSEDAEPLVLAAVSVAGAAEAGWIEEGIDVEGEPIFVHVEVVGVVAVGHSGVRLLMRLGERLGAATDVGVCEIVIGVGVGVADGWHDGDVAVVWIVVRERDTSQGVLKGVSRIGPIGVAVGLVDRLAVVAEVVEILMDCAPGLLLWRRQRTRRESYEL